MWQLIDVDPDDIRAPFDIKRVYYLYGTNADRGGHSHNRLTQVATSPVGGVTVVLEDSEGRTEVRLDDPRKGLIIGPGTWREMKDFTPDNVMVVLAEDAYDESDYVRDYATFKQRAGRARQWERDRTGD